MKTLDMWYIENNRQNIYFPIEFDSAYDGVRSVNEKWRKQVDDGFRVVLEGVRQPYLTITGSPMQRVEQILNFIK